MRIIYKVRKKTFVLYYVAVIFTLLRDRTDTRLCEPLWLIRLNCQLMTKLEMMPVLQAQVCGCVSAHPGLPPGADPRKVDWGDPRVKPTTVDLLTMILYNSENSVRDLRPFCRLLFVKAVLWCILHLSCSSEPVMRLDYQILLKSPST